MDASKILLQFLSRHFARVEPVHTELGIRLDGVHRRAQFMRHVRQEFRLRPIGCYCGVFGKDHFACPLLHQILQVITMLAQFLLDHCPFGYVLTGAAVPLEPAMLIDNGLTIYR